MQQLPVPNSASCRLDSKAAHLLESRSGSRIFVV